LHLEKTSTSFRKMQSIYPESIPTHFTCGFRVPPVAAPE
jgi:hypothetical protein